MSYEEEAKYDAHQDMKEEWGTLMTDVITPIPSPYPLTTLPF